MTQTNTQMTFFFSKDNPLSNWHSSTFTVKGITFCNNEQFMMYCKAKLFNDEECAANILHAKDPSEHKALGRQVKGFINADWEKRREHYVRIGCHAKFSQNPKMLKFLLDTGDTELVEASPYDRIWGVGLSANNPLIHDKANWRGLNLLGKVLMLVRADLRSEQGL